MNMAVQGQWKRKQNKKKTSRAKEVKTVKFGKIVTKYRTLKKQYITIKRKPCFAK